MSTHTADFSLEVAVSAGLPGMVSNGSDCDPKRTLG